MQYFKDSLIYKIIIHYFSKARNLRNESYLTLVTFVFYLSLWLVNPGNYIVLLAFIIYIFIVNRKLKNLRLSLLLAFLISSVVFTGKTYYVQLVGPGTFDPSVYPDGFLLAITITPSHILAGLMCAIMVRDFAGGRLKLKNFVNPLNGLVVVMYLWSILSSLIASKIPGISLALSILSLYGFILYFYIQAYITDIQRFLKFLLAIFLCFVLFQTTVALRQFISKSPIGKTIEYTKGFEDWGRAIDEQYFTYRPSGTFDHANTLAMHTTYWLLLLITAYLKKPSRLTFAFIVIGLATVVVTLSRSAWLGLVVSLLYMFYYAEKVIKIKVLPHVSSTIFIIGIFLFIAANYFILPRALKSQYAFSEGGGFFRAEQVAASWEIIKNRPMLGVGAGLAVLEGVEYFSDTIFGREPQDIHVWYMNIAVSHGVPMLVISIIYVIMIAKRSYYLITRSKQQKIKLEYMCYFASVIVFLVIGLFSANSGLLYTLIYGALLNIRKS